jgi:hypothetical protein
MQTQGQRKLRQPRPRQEFVQLMFRLPQPLGAAIRQLAEEDARTVASLMKKLALQHIADHERAKRAAQQDASA